MSLGVFHAVTHKKLHVPCQQLEQHDGLGGFLRFLSVLFLWFFQSLFTANSDVIKFDQ